MYTSMYVYLYRYQSWINPLGQEDYEEERILLQVRTYVCMYAYMDCDIATGACVCMYMCMYGMYVCIDTCTYAVVLSNHAHKNARTPTHINLYRSQTCMHTHIQTYTHTFTAMLQNEA